MDYKANAQAPEASSGDSQTYIPPLGPPPPILPAGWVARYDLTYERFYYVNLATKKSQWEAPLRIVDAPAIGIASGESRNAHYQPGPSAMSMSQIIPPEEATARYTAAYQQIPDKEQQNNTGPANQISSFFKHGSSRSEPLPQHQPPPQYTHQIAHPQAEFMAPKRSSGMGAGGAAVLGAGGGLLAGIALENAISSHGDNRYQRGFEDGAEYVENRSGALEKLEEESVQSEGLDLVEYCDQDA